MRSIDKIVADSFAALASAVERIMRCAMMSVDEVEEAIADGFAALASAMEWAITGDAP